MPTFDGDLLAAAVSAVSGVTVVHPNRGAHLPKFSIDNLFHATYIPIPLLESGVDEKEVFEIYVKTLTVADKKYTIHVTNAFTIAHVKASLEQMADTPGKDLRLVFNGKLLKDKETMKSAGIVPGSSLILWFDVKAAGCEFQLDLDEFAPKFNYDFTTRQSDGTYMRNKFEYHRPYGWYRYGLNVIGKYDDDKWLGPDGIRTDTSPNEWPVSYHGTNMENAKTIAKEGFSLAKSTRFKYGKGIYSTPLPSVAEGYSQEFKHNGSTCYVILQNRVNPKAMEVVNGDKYWISPNEKDIRPYGILVRNKDQMPASNSDSCNIL